MNLKKSLELSCTLSINFVEFCFKIQKIMILIFLHLSVFFLSKITSFCFQLPAVQLCYWVGFRISLSLSREGAIFWDEIENYFSCSRLARRDRDYHMTILVFRDENEIPFCYSHVSRPDRDFRKSFLVVEQEKMKLTLVENSRDREFSLTSGVAVRGSVWQSVTECDSVTKCERVWHQQYLQENVIYFTWCSTFFLDTCDTCDILQYYYDKKYRISHKKLVAI